MFCVLFCVWWLFFVWAFDQFKICELRLLVIKTVHFRVHCLNMHNQHIPIPYHIYFAIFYLCVLFSYCRWLKLCQDLLTLRIETEADNQANRDHIWFLVCIYVLATQWITYSHAQRLSTESFEFNFIENRNLLVRKWEQPSHMIFISFYILHFIRCLTLYHIFLIYLFTRIPLFLFFSPFLALFVSLFLSRAPC